MSNCNCKDWQEGHEQIVAAWAFCANHSGGPIYTGPLARFCPWCGACLRTRLQDGQGQALPAVRIRTLLQNSLVRIEIENGQVTSITP